MLIGYARVSTVGQDSEAQINKLIDLGVEPKRVYVDHGFSGKKMTRDGLEKALVACRAGDEFVVSSLDRLARNALGSLEVLKDLGERGIAFNNGGTIYNPQDTMAKMFLTILAAVAEAEGGWISSRTKEAMARPDVKRKLRGKQPKLTPKQDRILTGHFDAGEQDPTEIGKLFNVSRSSVYRAVARHRAVIERNATDAAQ